MRPADRARRRRDLIVGACLAVAVWGFGLYMILSATSAPHP